MPIFFKSDRNAGTRRLTAYKAVLPGLILTAGVLHSLQDSPPATQSDAEIEAFLKSGRVVSSNLIGQGVTKATKATLSLNGRVHDAQIQSISMKLNDLYDSKGKPVPWRDDYKHNIAAYKLDRLLGLQMVPPSIDRLFGKQRAAFTWWVDDVAMIESDRERKEISPPDPEAWKRQRSIADTFDQLIYNVDRNTGNLLIKKNWDLVMIDHTRAFAPNTRLMERTYFDHCSRPLLAALRKLDKATLTTALSPYLLPAQIDAMLIRRDLIVSHFDKLIGEKGEGAVLF